MAILKNTTINSTTALQLSTGTTAQRPASPSTGQIRYNTDLKTVEYYANGKWNYKLDITRDNLCLFLDAANPISNKFTTSVWKDIGTGYDVNLLNIATGVFTNPGISTDYVTFNGTSEFAVTTQLSNYQQTFNNFTVIVWFYPTSVTNYENVIDCNAGNTNYKNSGNIGPRLEMNNSGTLAWLISGNASNDTYNVYNVVASGLAANTWHCAAITRSSTPLVSTYYNGEPVLTGQSNSAGYANEMLSLNVGYGFFLNNTFAAERYFTGRVSVVQIYNKVLTAAEIKHNFNVFRGRYNL